MIYSNVKRLWGVATSCYNSCLTLASQTLRSSLSKCLTLSSLALTLSLLPTTSYGAPIRLTSSKTLPLSVYLEIISTVQCQFGSGEWNPYTETICSIDPSGRGTDETAATYISQHNGFLYLHEMRAYRDGYSDKTLLDILRGCRKFGVTKLLIETNFGDGIVAELFRKHLQQLKLSIDIEEVRANVRKEDRIIDSLEPVLNQHRLVVDRSVIDWDYSSNKDQPPEERLLYMLFYQMSRMCREKGAVKHDDRLDSLAQGVKYYTDCLAISAQEAVNSVKEKNGPAMIQDFLDNPQKSAQHLALGMTPQQIQDSKVLDKTDQKAQSPPGFSPIRPYTGRGKGGPAPVRGDNPCFVYRHYLLSLLMSLGDHKGHSVHSVSTLQLTLTTSNMEINALIMIIRLWLLI